MQPVWEKAEPTINVPGRPGTGKEYAIDLKTSIDLTTIAINYGVVQERLAIYGFIGLANTVLQLLTSVHP